VKTRLKRVRSYEGQGRLLENGSAVSYALHEYQETIPHGLKEIRGHIFLISGSLPLLGSISTLQLQDGREIKLISESGGGTSATVRATGGFVQ
jgi:hypothetical protein